MKLTQRVIKKEQQLKSFLTDKKFDGLYQHIRKYKEIYHQVVGLICFLLAFNVVKFLMRNTDHFETIFAKICVLIVGCCFAFIPEKIQQWLGRGGATGFGVLKNSAISMIFVLYEVLQMFLQ